MIKMIIEILFELSIIFYSINGFNSVVFCDNPKIDSAFSYEEKIYLFRENKFWIFWPKYNSVTQSKPLGSTFKGIQYIYNKII